MARLVFITLYDEHCHGVRILKAGLRRAGHDAYLVCWKTYSQTPIEKVENFYDGMHIEVFPRGDMVNSYSYPATSHEYDLLVEVIRKIQPDLIGFGMTNSQKHVAVELTELLKKHFSTPIMWGGHHPTTDPEWCLQYCNLVCRGESDEAILEIAEKMDNHQGFENIRNVWMKANGGRIVRNEQRPLILNLDSLPFPDFDEATTYYIDHNDISHGKPFSDSLLHNNYMTMTARGCPYRCSYCFNSYFKKLYKGERFVRFRSIGHVIEELKETKKRKGHFYLEILDSIFTLRWRRLEKFAEAYHREVDEPFWCYTHPRCCKEKPIAALTRYGNLQYIIMGIQSASDNIGSKTFHRRQSNKDILRSAKVLNKYGVRAYYDIITNVPGETEQDCRQNLDMLRSLPKPFRIRMSKISLFPNYDITSQTGEKKYVTNPMYRIWNALYFLTQDVSLTDEEVDAILKSKELFNNPTILEKINIALGDYEKGRYTFGVQNKNLKNILEIRDGEVACLKQEISDMRKRKGFRYFMALSNAARRLKRKIKQLAGK